MSQKDSAKIECGYSERENEAVEQNLLSERRLLVVILIEQSWITESNQKWPKNKCQSQMQTLGSGSFEIWNITKSQRIDCTFDYDFQSSSFCFIWHLFVVQTLGHLDWLSLTLHSQLQVAHVPSRVATSGLRQSNDSALRNSGRINLKLIATNIATASRAEPSRAEPSRAEPRVQKKPDREAKSLR